MLQRMHTTGEDNVMMPLNMARYIIAVRHSDLAQVPGDWQQRLAEIQDLRFRGFASTARVLVEATEAAIAEVHEKYGNLLIIEEVIDHEICAQEGESHMMNSAKKAEADTHAAKRFRELVNTIQRRSDRLEISLTELRERQRNRRERLGIHKVFGVFEDSPK